MSGLKSFANHQTLKNALFAEFWKVVKTTFLGEVTNDSSLICKSLLALFNTTFTDTK